MVIADSTPIATSTSTKIPSAQPPAYILANWPTMGKYWTKRHELLSRFDDGCRLDEESWFSVTPEWLAKETAERLRCDTIVDPFCGAGGNVIQFAMTCRKVIAMDIDPRKIEMARHNAAIYGVADRIEFRVGDFFADNSDVRADILFCSPPWGGPQYNRCAVFDLEADMQPGGRALMRRALHFADTVVMFLPRHTDSAQLRQLAEMCADPARRQVHIEQNRGSGRSVPGLTVYLGDVAGKCRPNANAAVAPVPPYRRMSIGVEMAARRPPIADDAVAVKKTELYVPPHIRAGWAASTPAATMPSIRRQTMSAGQFAGIFRRSAAASAAAAAAEEASSSFGAQRSMTGQRRRLDGAKVPLRTASFRRYDPIYRASAMV